MRLPVFFINAHSCLCPSKGKCFERDFKPITDLPKDTFVVSIAQSGDFSCVTEEQFCNNIDNIRRYLYHHSESDIEYANQIGKTSFSILSGLRRAVGPIEYPNINYTLNDWITVDGSKRLKPRSENEYGVYEMTSMIGCDLKNTKSILPQDAKRKDWSLEDIIKEVYKIKKIRSAIFISGGCLTACPTPKKAMSNNISKYGRLIDIANAAYTTSIETLIKEELDQLHLIRAQNEGFGRPTTFLGMPEMAKMLKNGLYSPDELSSMRLTIHDDNIKEVEKLMKRPFKTS